MAFSPSFKVMGIEIELHWSLLLLLLLIFAAQGIDAALYILFIFMFVVLHELSHSYVAIKNGVEVRKITLFPIGGMATIDDVAVSPDVEFKLALAGPLFNFVVIILALLLDIIVNNAAISEFLWIIIQINLVLGVFNLLPAIPLDGGRVWRSWREKKVGHLRATVEAVGLSRFIALLLLLLSLIIGLAQDDFSFLIWNSLISAVIYLGSQAELSIAVLKESAKGLFVRDAMSFSTFSIGPHSTLRDASSVMYATRSPVVIMSGSPLRLLSYRHLLGIERSKWGKIRAVDVAQPAPLCRMDEPILDAWKKMKSEDVSLLPVIFDGELIGAISEIDVEKLLVLSRLRTSSPEKVEN
ncbi:site-2 protease family protein [Candidatus Micrarchaeota archaeon]|nr:site-2 protease family protein [Candidatus Micrarchaeota archaeon]